MLEHTSHIWLQRSHVLVSERIYCKRWITFVNHVNIVESLRGICKACNIAELSIVFDCVSPQIGWLATDEVTSYWPLRQLMWVKHFLVMSLASSFEFQQHFFRHCPHPRMSSTFGNNWRWTNLGESISNVDNRTRVVGSWLCDPVIRPRFQYCDPVVRPRFQYCVAIVRVSVVLGGCRFCSNGGRTFKRWTALRWYSIES